MIDTDSVRLSRPIAPWPSLRYLTLGYVRPSLILLRQVISLWIIGTIEYNRNLYELCVKTTVLTFVNRYVGFPSYFLLREFKIY